MYLLALETSNDACSVALSTPQGISEVYELAPRRHAELLLPMVQQVLTQAGVDKRELQAIAYGCGPGAFIGVRIAASVTQGLALALQIPVLPVSSLAAMAQAQRERAATIVVANDARINEVYFAIYRSPCADPRASVTHSATCYVETIAADALLKPAAIDLSACDPAQSVVVGSAWQAYPKDFSQRYPNFSFIADCYPRAAQVAELALRDWQAGVRLSAAEAQPVYLRDNVVQKP